jgi:hypothetical protein
MATSYDAAAQGRPAPRARRAGHTLNATFSIPRHELLSQSAVYRPGDHPDGVGALAVPADVSFQHVSSEGLAASKPPRRLPLGIGLVVAASASVGLWFAVAAGVRALFF